jgi:amino-acid N-acetyltransferase
MADRGGSFSEREFYLAEFRGRTLGIALPDGDWDSFADLGPVLRELKGNASRIVLFSPRRKVLEELTGRWIPARKGTAAIGDLWWALREDPCAGVWFEAARSGEFAALCREWVVRLQLAKLIWIDARGAFRDASGGRVSLAALSDLGKLRAHCENSRPADLALLAEIQLILEGGISSVNLCALDGLADELFTYSGSGTLFTRERYMDVRRLGVDDFPAAEDLIERGVAEGFLAPRSDSELRGVLGNAFGVFVEGRYLAGIASLVPYPEGGMAEIVSLYTLTRFLGEGVGGFLIRYALQEAAEAGFAGVFACTTSERVERFFTRHGFEAVEATVLPAAKWARYPADRRRRVRCLLRSPA